MRAATLALVLVGVLACAVAPGGAMDMFAFGRNLYRTMRRTIIGGCPYRKDMVDRLAASLKENLAGQAEAKDVLLHVVKTWQQRTETTHPRPTVVVVTGPTGVGKTMTAREILAPAILERRFHPAFSPEEIPEGYVRISGESADLGVDEILQIIHEHLSVCEEGRGVIFLDEAQKFPASTLNGLRSLFLDGEAKGRTLDRKPFTLHAERALIVVAGDVANSTITRLFHDLAVSFQQASMGVRADGSFAPSTGEAEGAWPAEGGFSASDIPALSPDQREWMLRALRRELEVRWQSVDWMASAAALVPFAPMTPAEAAEVLKLLLPREIRHELSLTSRATLTLVDLESAANRLAGGDFLDYAFSGDVVAAPGAAGSPEAELGFVFIPVGGRVFENMQHGPLVLVRDAVAALLREGEAEVARLLGADAHARRQATSLTDQVVLERWVDELRLDWDPHTEEVVLQLCLAVQPLQASFDALFIDLKPKEQDCRLERRIGARPEGA